MAGRIYKYLEQKHSYELQVIGLTVSGKVLDEMEIPYRRISDYLDLFEDKETIKELGEELCEKSYDPKSKVPYHDMAVYLGMSFLDLIRQCGSKEKAKEIFESEGRSVFNPVFCMKRILEHIKPDLLVITCVVRMERAAAIAANQLCIPVVRIADLPIVEPMDFDCDLCVMNEYAKRYTLENHLLAEKKIHVTGQPVFADTGYLEPSVNQDFEETFKSWEYKHIITYLDAPLDLDSELIKSELERISHQNPDNLYIIKLHPNQFEDERWIGNNLCIIKECNTRVLLNRSDVVITRHSTAGIEAALFGKPLIVVFISGSETFDYSKFDIAVKIKKITELEEMITRCLDSHSVVNRTLQRGRTLFHHDGNALENIELVIRGAVKNSPG